MIDVLFFGRVADIMHKRQVRLPLNTSIGTLYALRRHLFGEVMESGRMEVATLRMSVNQTITRSDQPLREDDEIAFFSVFSGG